MSDLANICEHLRLDRTCTVFSDTTKAKTNRQLNCKNDQKTVCCYLCTFRLQCLISCKYLEPSETYVESKHVPKATPSCTVDKAPKDESLPLENMPVAFCFSCNIEMSWAKTQFAVDHWHGNKPDMLDDNKLLPVTVLLCPLCGKIEFKVDLAQKEAEV